MADDIIDLTSYIARDDGGGPPRGAMALWGAEGERSRFALPLWRIIYLAHAERGVIVSQPLDGTRPPSPFVALDLAVEPARTDVSGDLPKPREDGGSALLDRGAQGIVVHLGEQSGTRWSLVVDGGAREDEPLAARSREDILFLAGECAGLLFFRDLAAQGAVGASEGEREEE